MRLPATLVVLLFCMPATAQVASDLPVRISESVPAIEALHAGQKVKVQRIQDQGYRLQDDYARTSRPCPPFCIQPMRIAPGVDTVGELEMLDFMNVRNTGTRVLILDVRPTEFYRAETLPGAINVPLDVLSERNPARDKVIAAFGARLTGDGRWDFQAAQPLAIWADGAWSDSAPKTIKTLLALGYPADRLKYYRGGMQDWKKVGLTTVIPPRKP